LQEAPAGGGAVSMKITVKAFLDGNQVVAKTFDDGVYRIGRSDFSDVVLPHDSVSRSHLELRVSESAIYVTNMSGAGKLKVNGRLVETAEIQSGDEISVGPFKVLFMAAAEEEGQVGMGLPADNFGGEAQPPAEEGGFDNQNGFNPDQNQAGMEGPNGLADGLVPEGAPIELPNDYPGSEADASPAPAMLADPPSEGTQALNRAETQVELKPVVAKILFTEGPRAGEEMFLEAYEITMGRSKKADIFLDDEKLSRVHAKITRVGMGYRLIDLNSRNGTYVNGMRVLEHPLNSFDEIAIGNTKIKFLIHDLVASDMSRQQGGTLVAATPLEQTKSYQIEPEKAAELVQLQSPAQGNFGIASARSSGNGMGPPGQPIPFYEPEISSGKNRAKIVAGILLLLLVTYLVIPSEKEKVAPNAAVPAAGAKPALSDVKIPPSMPREYNELTAESQRQIEGYFNAAQQLADKEKYEEAVAYLKRIHEVLPYYKNSKELQDQFSKKVKEKQVAEAQEKAKRDEKKDLAIHLEDGLEYLKEGDFDRAGEQFNSAIILDPTNQTAIQGLKAAEAKVRRIEDIPPERDPEQEKRKLVAELFHKAVTAFSNKGYQEAIDTAEKVRQIELKGDTQYLNEAKQIIDRARMLQKEEFEPFLIQAKEKFAEGDYNASRDLCEEMLKRDNAYEEAKECVLKARKQLNRLAKEAYTHGYILESMNRIEEAKQYWNRAKNYVRSGDDYFDKVTKKLEYYQ